MKKILVTLLWWLLLFWGATSSQSMYCEYSESEFVTLTSMIQIFEKQAESKIIQRLFSDPELQDLVRIYTEEYLWMLYNAQEYCEYWAWSWEFPWSYEDLTMSLKKYVGNVLMLKKYGSSITAHNPLLPAMDNLREIVMWEWFSEQPNWWVEQTMKALFSLQLEEMDASSDIDIEFDIDSLSSLETWEFEAQMKLVWDINVMSPSENIVTSWSVWAEMKYVDGHMYLKLDNLDVELWDIQFDSQYEAQEFNAMLEYANLIKGKYIDIPLWVNWDIFGMMAAQQLEVFGHLEHVMKQDRMQVYAIEWDRMYAWMNPLACASLSAWILWEGNASIVWWCIEDWANMMNHTDGKWMMFFESENWIISMWITDTFAGDHMPDELRRIANVPLISWSDSEIVSLEIPLRDDDLYIWSIDYSDGVLNVVWSFMTESYDYETNEWMEEEISFAVEGKSVWEEFHMTWSLTWNDTEVWLDLTWSWWLYVSNFDMMVTVDFDDDYESVKFSLDLSSESGLVPNHTVVVPTQDEIINLENLFPMWY